MAMIDNDVLQDQIPSVMDDHRREIEKMVREDLDRGEETPPEILEVLGNPPSHIMRHWSRRKLAELEVRLKELEERDDG